MRIDPMAADYTALDAAILERLRTGKGHPKYSRTCVETARRIYSPGWSGQQIITHRLQALRKAGTIQYDRSIGWHLAR